MNRRGAFIRIGLLIAFAVPGAANAADAFYKVICGSPDRIATIQGPRYIPAEELRSGDEKPARGGMVNLFRGIPGYSDEEVRDTANEHGLFVSSDFPKHARLPAVQRADRTRCVVLAAGNIARDVRDGFRRDEPEASVLKQADLTALHNGRP